MFNQRIEVFGNIYVPDPIVDSGSINDSIVEFKGASEIQLRDYQLESVSNCLRDLDVYRSSLIVLATGLGKTILFSKIIQEWKGRVLVLVHLEELLQNAYQEIEAITHEVLGIERGNESHLGERIVVATVQSISQRLHKFSNGHFQLIIIDEAHMSASRQYLSILEHFGSAKVIGLTATDARTDGKRLPFDTCSYRMGILEGIEQGYLVPIRGKRIVIDQINLTRVKQTDSGDFDDEALDDEMVKGANAIADVIASDYAFERGILFFPGCASAKLTSELLNKRIAGISVYIDGKIVGPVRRTLVSQLRSGSANWLCNVGIAEVGFNWPEAAVIGMCSPTVSKLKYVQKAGRGTRPLQGLMNGSSESVKTSYGRRELIASSSKPFMTILDFVGISANLNLISHESLLDSNQEVNEKKERIRTESEEDFEDREDSSETRSVGIGISRIVSGVESKTLHSSEDFDPFEATGLKENSVELKVTHLPTDTLSEKQYKLLVRNGIDDASLTRQQAQAIVGFIASKGFRLSPVDRNIAKKMWKDLKSA